MTDIRKSLTTQGNNQDKKDSPAASLRKAIVPAQNTALAKPDVRTALPATYKAGGAIGFVIDATASRQQTWAEAQTIQRDMFNNVKGTGPMRLRLMHFGGGQMKDHGWKDDPRTVADIMAGVSCEGGRTMIVESLQAFVAGENNQPKPDSIIIVGDSFEEQAAAAYALAEKLHAKGVKIFAFHEGNDERSADVFRELARITGGAFAKFGADMPLKDLCNAVAAYSVGGSVALQRLAAQGDKAAKQIAQSTVKLPKPPQP